MSKFEMAYRYMTHWRDGTMDNGAKVHASAVVAALFDAFREDAALRDEHPTPAKCEYGTEGCKGRGEKHWCDAASTPLAAEIRREAAKCEECQCPPVQSDGSVSHLPTCSQAARPSPTTEAPETMLLYWCRDPLGGVHIDTHAGEWNGNRLVPFEAVRADVVEKRVVEAVEKTCNECLATTKAMLGAGDNEGVISAARRAVAERSDLKYEREKYYAKARTYGASAAKYREALVSIAKQGIEEARKAIGWNGQHCTKEEHEAIDRLLAAETREQAALARVRELEADLARVSNISEQRDASLKRACERAESAERELSVSKDDYRKACEELRTQQTKTVTAERELGEARAERDKAIKEKEASNNLRTHLRSMIDEAIEVLGGES